MEKLDHPLRAWRLAQEPRKTLAQLAKEIGEVTPSHLSEIENGKNEPSLSLAVRLSKATKIPVAEFDGWKKTSEVAA